MIELVFFSSAVIAIILNLAILSIVLRVPARRVALSTVFFLVVFFFLPPHWFSGLIVTLGAIGSILSHWYVSTRNRSLNFREKLSVKKATAEKGEITEDEGPISPFPAMNQGPGSAAAYSEMGDDEEERSGYDRAGHPTKRPSSKRSKKKSRKKTGAGGKSKERLVSTSDLPTAEKPTIEEYLKPKSNFFND
ncbi:hypothetical protein [Marinobacter sp.]|uniref:hypothetical protein n=1 Tax=Marinobacter sp. TaxID=50741 RepID=UPI0035667E34